MTDEPKQPQQKAEPQEPPPFFRHWYGMYWLLVGFLALQIIFFYLITLYYA